MSLAELRGATHMWQVMNVIVPTGTTPLTEEEIKEKILREATALQEFLNKPISEVFPQRQEKPKP